MNTPACAMNEVSALVNTDALPVNDDVPRCRVCGCTEEHGCPGGCCWVEDPEGGELCSACAEDEGDLVDSIQEDIDGARADLAAAEASGDHLGAVLHAGRVMACHLEAVVQDCGNCRGLGQVEGEECPDCAAERQAILDWGRACWAVSREKEAGPSVAKRLIRGIACHPASALAAEVAEALEELDRR